MNFLKVMTPIGFKKLAYQEYGNRSLETFFCVHGLSQNGLSFEYLAQQLLPNYVVSLDLLGRGNSDCLNDYHLYNFHQYLNDCYGLCLALGSTQNITWIGTSLGGLLGMQIAALSDNPIKRLVLNDIGPFVSMESLQSIFQRLRIYPIFNSLEEAGIALKDILKSFGLKDSNIPHFLKHNFWTQEDGKVCFAYDPKIVLKEPNEDIDMWNIFQQIKCPILVIRGAKSTVLTEDILAKMHDLNNVTSFVVEGVGHAPLLMDEEQTLPILEWLDSTNP